MWGGAESDGESSQEEEDEEEGAERLMRAKVVDVEGGGSRKRHLEQPEGEVTRWTHVDLSNTFYSNIHTVVILLLSPHPHLLSPTLSHSPLSHSLSPSPPTPSLPPLPLSHSLSPSPSPLPVEPSHKKQPQRKFFRDDDSEESD